MKFFLVLLALTTPLLSFAAPAQFPTQTPTRFLVLGDTGTGHPGQHQVARAIETVCQTRECQFAVIAGDNIYEYGVRSAQDPQFQDKFEKPYAKLSFPFFLALGNHDQSGTIPGSGVHPERGDFEVAYTQRSSKWMMPKRYYHFAFPVQNPTDYQSPVEQPVI